MERKIILILCLVIAATLSQDIKCIDGNNSPVDWWISYKLPKLASSNSHISSGLGYAFIDEKGSQFTIPSSSISDSTSFLARTLNQLYKNGSSIGYVIWNDESPDGGQNNNRAHAKGLVVFNSKGGFFLRHSIPNFPPKRAKSFSYPSSGTIYGQTLICLSIDIDTVDKISSQFLVNYPQVYDSYIPSSLTKYKNILSLSLGQNDNNRKTSVITIKTKGGLSVQDFAKSKQWDNDLWDSLVAPTLRQNLFVETWGRPLQPSSCKNASHPYEVMNVKEVKINNNVFAETKDHSKWGLSQSGSTTCIGDINRMTSQRKRGGGTSCFSVSKIHSLFSTIINQRDRC